VRPAHAATAEARQPRSAPSSAAPRRGSEYAELSRQVKQAGLLERRPGYYAWKFAVTVGLLAAGWAAFVVVGDSWWQLAVAVFLAVVFTQIGFLGHDAGHRQVFGTRRASYAAGLLLGNLGIGLSYGWWVGKHNRHHAHPNTEDADPDIAVGALAFTPAQARAGRGVARLVFRCQAYLFFPLLPGEAVSLHVASVQALTRRSSRHRFWERALITVHAAGYLTAVFLVLSPVKAVVFIIVQQGLFGLYLGCSFAPNHKGMPVLDAADRADFLRRQVLTSRNVRGGWLTDFALGGLNYQIEHHLFPSTPRPNLRRSQAMIEVFCRQRGVPTPTAAWRAPTPRRCGTSTPPAGPPAPPPRPDRRPATRRPACHPRRRLHAAMLPGAIRRRRRRAGRVRRIGLREKTPVCRPGPVRRKSLVTGAAGAARRETPGSPARRPVPTSTARPLASRQLTRARPVTSRLAAGEQSRGSCPLGAGTDAMPGSPLSAAMGMGASVRLRKSPGREGHPCPGPSRTAAR
jgi:fatty acid desaturase